MEIKKGIRKLQCFRKPFENALDVSDFKGLMPKDLTVYETIGGCVEEKVSFVITDRNILIPQGIGEEYVACGWQTIDCITIKAKASEVIEFSFDGKEYSFIIDKNVWMEKNT